MRVPSAEGKLFGQRKDSVESLDIQTRQQPWHFDLGVSLATEASRRLVSTKYQTKVAELAGRRLRLSTFDRL